MCFSGWWTNDNRKGCRYAGFSFSSCEGDNHKGWSLRALLELEGAGYYLGEFVSLGFGYDLFEGTIGGDAVVEDEGDVGGGELAAQAGLYVEAAEGKGSLDIDLGVGEEAALGLAATP